MKIAVCGKGGSGKSTICALLAKSLAKKGYNVLVVDIDESNYGLHSLLGMDKPEDVMDSFGGKSGYGKKMQSMREKKSGNVFGKKWSIDKIPGRFVSKKDGIKLAATGKVHDFGEGCACPMGSLSKQFLENLIVKDNDTVIVDTEAGIEHLGRSIERGFDHALIVVDPTSESLKLSKKMEDMLTGNVKNVHFVLNRVDDEVKDEVLKAMGNKKVLAIIPPVKELFMASLKGEEVNAGLKEIDDMADALKGYAEAN